jgi:hypothetical protein
MFHAKYLSSSYFVFLKKIFKVFMNIQIKKINDRLLRGQFLPTGFYLNKLGRNPLEDVSCLIS